MDDIRQTTGITMAIKDGDSPGPDDLLSAAEAAEVMGVTDAHVRRVIGAGELPAQRVGARSWVVRRADAEAWAKVQRRTGPRSMSVVKMTNDELLAYREAANPLAPPTRIRGIPANVVYMAADSARLGGGMLDLQGVKVTVTAEEATFTFPARPPVRDADRYSEAALYVELIRDGRSLGEYRLTDFADEAGDGLEGFSFAAVPSPPPTVLVWLGKLYERVGDVQPGIARMGEEPEDYTVYARPMKDRTAGRRRPIEF